MLYFISEPFHKEIPIIQRDIELRLRYRTFLDGPTSVTDYLAIVESVSMKLRGSSLHRSSILLKKLRPNVLGIMSAYGNRIIPNILRVW